MVLFGFLDFIGGGMIVVAVESRAFEDDSGAGADFPLEGVLAAFRAFFQMSFRHILKFFKFVSAACANILISRHFSFSIVRCLFL